jgi:hypothetical protein
MAGNSAEPGRSVTSKVVAILLTFHNGNEHSLTEIAQLTCLPISATHRLVTELAGWGVLERTEDSRFCVGLPSRRWAAEGRIPRPSSNRPGECSKTSSPPPGRVRGSGSSPRAASPISRNDPITAR